MSLSVVSPLKTSRMRASGNRRGQTRYAPYGPNQLQRSSAATDVSSARTTTHPPSTDAGETWRDVCLRFVGIRHPDFKPRNDFELFTLGTTRYRGPPSGLGSWLDARLAQSIQDVGSLESVMEMMRNILAMSTNNITGLKPIRAGNGVFQRAIPNSAYSIRLFPGCLVAREYCLDFVNTQTGAAVNHPFDFELLAVPRDRAVRRLGVPIATLQETFGGLPKEKIIPGQETYVLMDGQTYLLRRKGHRDVRFTVPVRETPVALNDDNVDELSFPATVAL